MTFANTDGGIELDTTGFADLGETDLIKILFAENPALVAQVEASKIAKVDEILTKAVREVFDLRPYFISKRLNLKRPNVCSA